MTADDAGTTPEITIPGYEIHRLLGTGGMAHVFHATQLNLKRQVALKVMLPAIAQRERSVQRFLAEAQLAAQVTHVNVVLVYDLGNAEGHPYIAMELVDGGDVVDLMKQVGGRLPLKRGLELIRDAGNGASAIHAAGLLHRDIKPHNILINRQGVGKISDLGLAFAAGSGDNISVANATVGTPAFMSPEQAEGTRDLDQRTDIYALGASLYTMVCGRPPFGGDEPWSVINQVLSSPPPDPRQFGVSEQAAMLIEKAMAKDPDNRHQSVREFLGLVEMLIAAEEHIAPAAPQPQAPPAESQPQPQPRAQAQPPVQQAPQSQSQAQTQAQAPAEEGKEGLLGQKRSFNISELYPDRQEEEDPFAVGGGPSEIFRKAASADLSNASTAAEIATRRHNRRSSTAQHIKAMQDLQQQAAENLNRFQEGLAQGAVFGQYRIQTALFETTCVTMHVAAHTQTQKSVFLAIVKRQMCHEESFAGWWEGFIAALKRSLHQRLTPLLEAGETDGQLFAVFEHGRQISLTHLLADEGELQEEEALGILGQLADGLKTYQQNGIVHRLIDPSNVYLDTEGVFSLGPPCCDMPGENTFLQCLTTSTTHLAIAHQSPERTVGEHKRISAATDIYSLGALLFSMLRGRPPYEDDDTLNLTLKVMSNPLPSHAEVLPGISDATREILDKIFVKDLAARLHDVDDLLFMLNRLNVGTPIKQQLKGVLHSRGVYPNASEDMLQVMEYLDADDPDRMDLLKAASLIVLQQPSLRLWRAIHQLGAGTWMERKADSIIDVLDGSGLKEPRRTIHVGGEDGVAELAQAIEDAPAYGCVSIRPGQYSGGVRITKPLFLVGEGRAKEVVISSGDAAAALTIACDGVMVCGMTIVGHPETAGGKAIGLDIADGRSVVCNCYLQAANMPALAVHGENTRPFIADCRIRQCGSSGVFFYDKAAGLIENCEISQNQLAGMEIAKHAAPTVRSCNILKNQRNGVLIWQNGGGTLEKCTISGSKLPGLEVRDKSEAQVERCRIHSGDHCGVLIHDQSRCTCRECEIANNKMPGAVAKAGGQLDLENCRVMKGMRSGICVLENGTVTMRDTGVQGNLGAAIEARPLGRIQAENCIIEYGKTMGVVAYNQAVGYVSDCVFDGADPLQAAKIEKGCKVAIENMKTKS